MPPPRTIQAHPGCTFKSGRPHPALPGGAVTPVEILRKLPERPGWATPFLVGVSAGKGVIYQAEPDPANPPYLPCVGTFLMFDQKPFWLEVSPVSDAVPALVSTGPTDRSAVFPPQASLSRQLVEVPKVTEKEIAVIAPVLESLQSGFYTVSLVHHWPTVGDEFLFWEAFGKNCRPPALLHGSDPRDGLFLFPTTSDGRANENLVAKYEEGIASGRHPVGISLYHRGRLSLLLDGHHRAVAYARLEQDVPCIHIEHVPAAVRIEGGLRQPFLDLPVTGEVFIDNMSASAKAIGREAIQLGSGKRVIERDVARAFVKTTGVDNVLRTEAY